MLTPFRVEPPLASNVTHESDALVLAMLGPVCIAIWRKRPTWQTFELQRKQLASAVAGHPLRAAFLCLVEENTEPPEQALRAASAEMIESHHGQLSAVACVVEGSGFRAAITRTVLSSMMLLARSMPPVRVFDSAFAATPWLSSKLGGMDLSTLAHGVDDLRRHR
ncbi:MAG TPA: hypothetical protein VM686_39595 [Polyangiaceae bacterium]|nr:hypothetical protein [Polyangiaceae bacterium]